MFSLLTTTDSYKMSHWLQYPKDTAFIHSYLSSRGGQFDEVVFAGLQYYLQNYLEGQVLTPSDLDLGRTIAKNHLGDEKLFNWEGWRHILDNHGGYLPLEIRAVPEGSAIPTGNVLLTIKNTDPKVPWLVGFVETLFMKLWYPCTVSTLSREIKKTILEYLIKTGTPESIDFKLHDFGARSCTSPEASAIGGFAHLINFKGTDTLAGLEMAVDNYEANWSDANSIPATEHSTITSWGQEHEVDAYRNLLKTNPTGLVACVSDSYDIYNACSNIWGGILRNEVMSRQGTLIIRPDSGDPITVVIKLLDILTEKFGYEVNSKGYKVLPPQVRIIQGDGVNQFSIRAILETMSLHGYSADNIAFGMGTALLQNVNRDTQKFAFKASSITLADGITRDVFKDPVDDKGKASLKGELALVNRSGELKTIRRSKLVYPDVDLLQTVFLNGEIKKYTTLEAIRERAKL